MWSTIDNTSSRPTAIWSNNMDMMSRSSYLTRSNSTVSSSTVSLRLFKDICRTGGVAGLRAISNDDYGVSNVGGCGASEEPDDDFVGSENMDESMSIGASTKSRHQSQASSTATNNHVSHKEVSLPHFMLNLFSLFSLIEYQQKDVRYVQGIIDNNGEQQQREKVISVANDKAANIEYD